MTSSIQWILPQKPCFAKTESANSLEKAGHIQTQEAPSGIGMEAFLESGNLPSSQTAVLSVTTILEKQSNCWEI